MAKKPITKTYLRDRCHFENQTVVKALKHNDLWKLVKQLDPNDQYAIFKVVDRLIKPLSEDQIDSLFAYLPQEIREGLDMISMDKAEKLEVVRSNEETLKPVIKKKGFSEKIALDAEISVPIEVFSSEKLWDIIKSGKYNLI